MPGLSTIRQRVARSPLKWRYRDNLRPLLSYRFNGREPLSAEAVRVLDEFNRRGIAITTVDALLGDDALFRELSSKVADLEREWAAEVEAARAVAQDGTVEKAFNFSHVGRRKLTVDDIFIRFAIQKPILQIANAYFGMYTHLRYCNVWRTFATQAPARDSQLWHRDRDDRLIVKVFVYLSDVDEGAGPFTYAPGTHPKGEIRGEPAYRIEREGGPKRTEDEEMAALAPRERWVTATGLAGSIVFADTRGYHKGGLARERDRLMYINMFASSASARADERFIDFSGADSVALDSAQRFALSV